MRKTWITVRIEDGRPPAVAAVGTDDVTDSTGAVHSVTESVPLELPGEVRDALAGLASAAREELGRRLVRSAARHRIAVEDRIEKGLLAKAKAALRALVAPKAGQN
jgi:hypothetical protein